MNDSSCVFLGLDGSVAMSVIRRLSGVTRSLDVSVRAEDRASARPGDGFGGEPDYSPGGLVVSPPAGGASADQSSFCWYRTVAWVTFFLMGGFALSASRQYPGRITKA